MALVSALVLSLLGPLPAGAAYWSNWDGSQTCAPTAVLYPESEADVQEIVKSANAQGTSVKVFGGGHSYSNIALTGANQSGVLFGTPAAYPASLAGTEQRPGVLLSLDRLGAVLSVDHAAMTVRVQAGIRLYQLYAELEELGLAVPATGGIMMQSLAGAAATATHGSGLDFTSLSERIVGGRLVVANGTVLTFGPENPDLWHAAQTSLGALGVITELTVQCVPFFQIHTAESALEDLAELGEIWRSDVELHDRMKWYWTPGQRQGLVKRFRRCPALPANGSEDASPPAPGCVTWYKAITEGPDLPHGLKTIESEFFMDVESLPQAVEQFHSFVESHRDRLDASVNWQLVGRFVAAEQGWMAMAHGRRSAALTMKMMCNTSLPGGEPYGNWSFAPRSCTDAAVLEQYGLFTPALERITFALGGRPHWGKINGANATHLAGQYPRFRDFVRLREELDPKGTFMNAYLRQRLELVEEAQVEAQVAGAAGRSLRGAA